MAHNTTECMSVPHSTSSVGYGLNGLGIALGCVGSISINIGNNLQSRGLDELNPSQSTWLLGTVIFFVASIIQFVAFAFAPASVVAPLESLQFVANLCFAKFINGKTITSRMYAGTCLILLGTIIAVVFGPVDGTVLIPLSELILDWEEVGWIVYLSLIVVAAAAAEAAYRVYAAAEAKGERRFAQQQLKPVFFALSSSLIGTQAVVQAKCMAEAVKLMTAGCAVEVLTSWYPYTTLILLGSCGALWLVRLNQALKDYDPLFIIPLLQSCYIVCAVVSGGLYFREFVSLPSHKVVLFVFGILVLLIGLSLMLPEGGGATDGGRGGGADLELASRDGAGKSNADAIAASRRLPTSVNASMSDEHAAATAAARSPAPTKAVQGPPDAHSSGEIRGADDDDDDDDDDGFNLTISRKTISTQDLTPRLIAQGSVDSSVVVED